MKEVTEEIIKKYKDKNKFNERFIKDFVTAVNEDLIRLNTTIEEIIISQIQLNEQFKKLIEMTKNKNEREYIDRHIKSNEV